MAEKTINARIQCKIDTAENWKTNNPVLLVGELGVESDTKLIKVGDGTTSWTSLPYLQYLPLSGGQLTGELRINDKQVAVVDDIPTALSQLSEDTTHRVVTDTEKATWNAKSNFDGNYNSLTNKPTIPTNADFTLAGLKEKSYNSLTDKPTIPTKTSQLTNDSNFATTSQIPDISGKANLSGGNTFSGTQTFNNAVNIKGTGKCRSKVLVTYNLGSALVQIRKWGMGRIDYLLGDGKTLRHEFGQAWINDGVTFTNAYSTVLWCTATPDCSADSQIQRFSINSCSTTKMTFKGGADQIVRWEVWGIIN